MTIKSFLPSLVLPFLLFADPQPSLAAQAPRNGIAEILIKNDCHYPVSVGKTQGFGGWDMPAFASIAPGQMLLHALGPDSQKYEGLSFRFFPEGKDPGAPNSSLVEFGLNSEFMHLDWPNLSSVDGYNKPGLKLEADHFATKTCDAPAILQECPENRRIRAYSGEVIACTKGDVWLEPTVRDEQFHPVAVLIKRHCGENTYSYSRDDQDDFPGSVMTSADTEDLTVSLCPNHRD